MTAVRAPRLVHLTTTDMSLDWLLGPQLRAFADAGYEVIGVSSPGPHVGQIEAAGVRHVAVDELTRSNNPADDVRAMWRLVATLRDLDPDILHTHNPKPGVMGRIAGRLARVPLVVNTQHGLYAQPGDPARRRLPVYAAERTAAAFGHIELVQNAEDVATLVRTLRVPARKVRLLGNGIDLERFAPSDRRRGEGARRRGEWGLGADAVVCGIVGRLVAEKGVEEVVEAAESMQHDHDLRFVWIGPTDEGKSDAVTTTLLDRARAAGIILTGARTDMPECYAAFDLFLTASWREGFPRAVMEASAMGLPVVATDVRGNRQAVRHGATGLLTPVRDPVGLARAVRSLADDPALRSRLGRGAQDLAAAEFDQQRIIERTLAAYADGGVAPPT